MRRFVFIAVVVGCFLFASCAFAKSSGSVSNQKANFPPVQVTKYSFGEYPNVFHYKFVEKHIYKGDFIHSLVGANVADGGVDVYVVVSHIRSDTSSHYYMFALDFVLRNKKTGKTHVMSKVTPKLDYVPDNERVRTQAMWQNRFNVFRMHFPDCVIDPSAEYELIQGEGRDCGGCMRFSELRFYPFQSAGMERLQAAEPDNAEAAFAMGLKYDQGAGVPQDKAQARQWFEKAYKLGSYDAAYHLGYLYYFGHGCERVMSRAGYYFSQGCKRDQLCSGSVADALAKDFHLFNDANDNWRTGTKYDAVSTKYFTKGFGAYDFQAPFALHLLRECDDLFSRNRDQLHDLENPVYFMDYASKKSVMGYRDHFAMYSGDVSFEDELALYDSKHRESVADLYYDIKGRNAAYEREKKKGPSSRGFNPKIVKVDRVSASETRYLAYCDWPDSPDSTWITAKEWEPGSFSYHWATPKCYGDVITGHAGDIGVDEAVARSCACKRE